jgi:Ca-activated chloride channel family protein
MIISFFLLFHLNAFANETPSVIYKNNSAVNLFTKEKFAESKNLLENEVVDHPKVGALHYNLGVIHENSKEPEKAIQEYTSAVKVTDDKKLQFEANFNAARVYGEQKDISNALRHYQAALEIIPDSQEVKTNIEMLLQSNGGGGGQDQNKDQKQDQKDDKDQKKDGKDQQKPQQPDQQKNDQQKKPAPKPFKSEDLSEQDVRKILNELKRQEEQIRAKLNNDKTKETPVEKDW